MARSKHTTARPLHRVGSRSKPSLYITPRQPLHITPRQREILRLVALGHTNREIGATLDISVRTVEVHRFNLMRRLNVRNVAQLLRQALQQNLLPRNFGMK